jgi:hypothetical protein
MAARSADIVAEPLTGQSGCASANVVQASSSEPAGTILALHAGRNRRVATGNFIQSGFASDLFCQSNGKVDQLWQ